MYNPYKQYFDVLEIDEKATFAEIKSSYRFLKKLYSNDESFVSGDALEDFSETQRIKILNEIEDAYRKLKDYHMILKADTPRETPELPEDTTFSGPVLREIRIKMKIRLREISEQTNIRKTYLSAIETEDFDILPPPVYTRGFVKAYAEFLSLDAEKVVKDFMDRYMTGKDNT